VRFRAIPRTASPACRLAAKYHASARHVVLPFDPSLRGPGPTRATSDFGDAIEHLIRWTGQAARCAASSVKHPHSAPQMPRKDCPPRKHGYARGIIDRGFRLRTRPARSPIGAIAPELTAVPTDVCSNSPKRGLKTIVAIHPAHFQRHVGEANDLFSVAIHQRVGNHERLGIETDRLDVNFVGHNVSGRPPSPDRDNAMRAGRVVYRFVARNGVLSQPAHSHHQDA
jgi:hypothetical protein